MKYLRSHSGLLLIIACLALMLCTCSCRSAKSSSSDSSCFSQAEADIDAVSSSMHLSGTSLMTSFLELEDVAIIFPATELCHPDTGAVTLRVAPEHTQCPTSPEKRHPDIRASPVAAYIGRLTISSGSAASECVSSEAAEISGKAAASEASDTHNEASEPQKKSHWPIAAALMIAILAISLTAVLVRKYRNT